VFSDFSLKSNTLIAVRNFAVALQIMNSKMDAASCLRSQNHQSRRAISNVLLTGNAQAIAQPCAHPHAASQGCNNAMSDLRVALSFKIHPAPEASYFATKLARARKNQSQKKTGRAPGGARPIVVRSNCERWFAD
jgi:hypothetical protein